MTRFIKSVVIYLTGTLLLYTRAFLYSCIRNNEFFKISLFINEIIFDTRLNYFFSLLSPQLRFLLTCLTFILEPHKLKIAEPQLWFLSFFILFNPFIFHYASELFFSLLVPQLWFLVICLIVILEPR